MDRNQCKHDKKEKIYSLKCMINNRQLFFTENTFCSVQCAVGFIHRIIKKNRPLNFHFEISKWDHKRNMLCIEIEMITDDKYFCPQYHSDKFYDTNVHQLWDTEIDGEYLITLEN